MYFLAVKDSGALQICQSQSSLYRGCDDFIRLSASWRVVATQRSILALGEIGNVVAVEAVCEPVG